MCNILLSIRVNPDNIFLSQEPSPAVQALAPVVPAVVGNEEAEEDPLDDVEVLQQLMGRQLSVSQFTCYDLARSYAQEMLHQQITILRVIFQSQETQCMSAL